MWLLINFHNLFDFTLKFLKKAENSNHKPMKQLF